MRKMRAGSQHEISAVVLGGGLRGGTDSRVLTREGSLEAKGRVCMGTTDSAPGKLALLALELHFSHSHQPLG